MPDLVTGEENDDDNDNDSERVTQSSIPLSISVLKKGGPYLEFNCVGYPDEIVIDGLSVKNPDLTEDQVAYEGPDFQYVLFFCNYLERVCNLVVVVVVRFFYEHCIIIFKYKISYKLFKMFLLLGFFPIGAPNTLSSNC